MINPPATPPAIPVRVSIHKSRLGPDMIVPVSQPAAKPSIIQKSSCVHFSFYRIFFKQDHRGADIVHPLEVGLMCVNQLLQEQSCERWS